MIEATMQTMYRIILGSFFIIFIVSFALPASARVPDDHYVRTANYFLKAGTDISPSIYEQLSRYDVLILPMEAAAYNRDFFRYARTHNPDITILAYIPSRSINIKDIDDGAGFRKKLQKGIQPDWYLREPSGLIARAWPETLPMNVATGWNEYLPQFVATTVMSDGVWDGILYDEVDAGISFLNGGNLDLNGDGNRDQKDELDAVWRDGISHILSKTRQLLGSNAIILINGSSHPAYQPYINGRMFESFPTPWEGGGHWEDSMDSYLTLSTRTSYEPFFIINSNTANTGRNTIFQKVRFGLTSALMGNGYFGFDFGTQNHGQLWWYDEYDVYLGKPSGSPYLEARSTPAIIRDGVWRRDFQQGTVLVNSTDTLQEADLDGEFEKIRGIQDGIINDGAIVSSVSLPPSDGIILLRPLSSIFNASFQNGSFARVFDGKGTVTRNGFFAYDATLRGSISIIETPRMPSLKRIIADSGIIRSTDAHGIIHSFKPFLGWNGDLNIALDTSDMDNLRIFVSKEYPSGDIKKKKKGTIEPSSISVFSPSGTLYYHLYPLGKNYTGSLRFALGDLNADKSHELVVSAGAGTEPIIRILDTRGKLLSGGFLAYQKTFRGGVFVAIADTDGNGYGKIITSPGSGGTPLVRLFDNKARALNPGFLAFSAANKGGVRVINSDIDNDGKDEIIATTTKVFTYALR